MNHSRLRSAPFGMLLFLVVAFASGCSDAGEESLAQKSSWQPLVEGSWNLEPGSENYFCVRKTIDRELYVRSFRAIAPLGTHHTVLTVGAPSGPDGTSECSTVLNHDSMLYGSGVGAEPFSFSKGVAVKIPKGSQLLLNLHVFNAFDQPLGGLSAIEIEEAEVENVQNIAEAVLMGPTTLHIPPGPVEQSGRCTLAEDASLVAVGPHMHQLGDHLTAVAHSSLLGDITIHDEDYDFDSQQVYPLATPVPMRAGDWVEVRCHYTNKTPKTVGWGESSLDEMCFAGVYRYPVQTGGFFVCTE
jgi:hypothetical protein